MRARGASSAARLPLTSAMTLSDLSEDSKPNSRKVPYSSVGRLVSATFVAFMRSRIISRRCGAAVFEDDVVAGSVAAIRPSGNKTEACRSGHLINDRVAPTVFTYEQVHIRGVKNIRQRNNVARVRERAVCCPIFF